MIADAENDGDRGPAWGTRKRPPTRRDNVTLAARIGGPDGKNVHVTIGFDGAGKAVEVFVTVDKEGSVFRGLLDTVARLASAELQRGAGVAEVVKQLRGARFEPSGIVVGHPTITDCVSVVDLVGQMLAAEVGQ